jgi:hypothetical protein
VYRAVLSRSRREISREAVVSDSISLGYKEETMKPSKRDLRNRPVAKRTGQWAWLFLSFCLGGPLLFGQQPPAGDGLTAPRKSLAAVRISAPIRMDGVLDEEAWRQVASADHFIQAEPYEGEQATEQTDVKVLYDSENLYVGVYCHDSEPDGILVNSLKEDFDPGSADAFEMILDTFLDGRNGFLFTTNPEGAKRDAQMTDEGRNVNADWDTVWDVRAQRNGDGWTAEMVIPFKSLSFDANRAEQVWGINFGRRVRRKNEVDYWAPVPRRYDITRLSLAGELRGLEGIERGRNLRVKPFVLTEFKKFARQDFDFDPDGGMDAKYSVTPSLTLDLTFNTDFSQVEVDEQQVNLTRFPLFFPEKREFFLENDGIFQFGDLPVERGNRSKETQLFFSRRIGLFPEGHPRQGEPIDIWGGARLSGRLGKYSLGILSLQTKPVDDDPDTADVDESQPGNNFGVVRVKRDILANSDIGAIFTNRQASSGGDFNRAWGADANFRFGQNFTVNGYLAQTKTDGDSGDDRAEKITVQWWDNFLRWQTIYSNNQEHFNPEMGFQGYAQWKGARSIRYVTELHPRPPRNRIVRELLPHYRFLIIMDQAGRTVFKEGHYAFMEVHFQNGSVIEFLYAPFFDRLERPSEIAPGVILPPGGYQYGTWDLQADTDPSKILSAVSIFRRGDYYTGRLRSVDITGTFRPNYRFSAQANVTDSDVNLPEGAFTTRVFRARLTYSFNTRMFLNALVQYNNTRKQVTSNIRFNFIHRPLSDLFVVYNESREVSGARRNDRAVTIKYTHLLAF